MWWLLLLVIVIIAAFAVPRFGKALLGTVAVVVVVIAVYIFDSDRRNKAETAAARTRIQFSEVELVDLGLQPRYKYTQSGSYTLVGRVRNGSAQYTLSQIRLKLTMRDCTEPAGCETVGEVDESIYLSVPPGQARDLDEFVDFSGLGQPRGKHQWDYQLLEVSGK
jgi:hypothetical protein